MIKYALRLIFVWSFKARVKKYDDFSLFFVLLLLLLICLFNLRQMAQRKRMAHIEARKEFVLTDTE